MTVTTELFVNGSIVTDNYSVNLVKSANKNDSSTFFTAEIDNHVGKNKEKYGIGDTVVLNYEGNVVLNSLNSGSYYEVESEGFQINIGGTDDAQVYATSLKAQAFQTGFTGPNSTIEANKVNVRIRRQLPAFPGADYFYVDIYNVDDNYRPSGISLTTGSLPTSGVLGPYAVQTVNISPVELAKNTSYALVLSVPDAGTATSGIAWSYVTGSTIYSGADLQAFTAGSPFNNGSWTSIGGTLQFEILGDIKYSLNYTGIVEDVKYRGVPNEEYVVLSGRDYILRLMDRTVEPEVYTNLPIGSIARDIINKYTDDITLDNAQSGGLVLPRKTFKHQSVYDALNELAELGGYNFFVDNDKDLHFFPDDEAINTGYTFNNENILKSNIKEQRDTVFNEIWVYGERYLDSFKEEFTAGSPLGGSVFELLYKPHNTQVDTGSPISQFTRQVGGISNFNIIPISGVNYLVSYDDRTITFVSGTSLGYSSIPSSGTLVTIDYDRLLPIVKVGRNQSSIEQYGKRVKVIIDKNIRDPDDAVKVMKRELTLNSEPKKEGNINVYGFYNVYPPQTCVVDLPYEGIDNETYNIIETSFDFNKRNNFTDSVQTIKVSKKISDITDVMKDFEQRLRKLEGQDIDETDLLTRLEYSTGSFSIRTSGIIVSIRSTNYSFVLGNATNGLLGSQTFQPILGDFGSPFTIIYSGGYP